jgi:hypothetical protein
VIDQGKREAGYAHRREWRQPGSDLVQHLVDLLERSFRLLVALPTLLAHGNGRVHARDKQAERFDRDCQTPQRVRQRGDVNPLRLHEQHDLDTDSSRLVTRLLQRRRIDPDGGCWHWQGRRDRCGYGRITVAHRRWSVHRLAASLWLGLEPASGLHVLHRYHTPSCFRPDHLYLGTAADNTNDRNRRRTRSAR